MLTNICSRWLEIDSILRCIFVGALRVKISNTFSHIIELSQTFLKALPCHFFVMKMQSACYVCCIYSNALRKLFSVEAKNMNPDQTALEYDKRKLVKGVICHKRKNVITSSEVE